MKLVSRGDTTVVDAYLSPILRRYVERSSASSRRGATASIGSVHAVDRRADRRAPFPGQGRDPVRPAGGIVGAVRSVAARGFDRVIGFDMGGTSTDVTHYAGEYERVVRDRGRGRAPAGADDEHSHGGRGRRLDLHVRRRALARGPAIAGADPGPACYRRGGPLTVTDCNVMVGKLDPALFPAGLRAATAMSRSTREVVRDKFEALAAQVAAATGHARTRRKRSPTASSTSPSRTWRTRSSTSRCSAATTSPSTRCAASAVRAVSMRAASPMRSACAACSSIHWPVCCPRTAWASPTSARCGSAPSRRGWRTRRSPSARAVRGAGRQARARCAGPGHRGRRASACERVLHLQVRRYRHDAADRRARTQPRSRERRIRAPLPAAVRLPDAGQAARHRGDRRRSSRQGAGRRRTNGRVFAPRAGALAARSHQSVHARAWRDAAVYAREACARATRSTARR